MDPIPSVPVSSFQFATREVIVPPNAASLIEGHRDFGYTVETALADLIDNSISAKASFVKITVESTGEEPWIALSDDGVGMDEGELIQAMTLGSKNPKDERERQDLGRFGLGLKSASFSQCRSLTVLTRKNKKTSCARWDLDRVSDLDKWSLELIDTPDSLKCHELLEETGTVVFWEKLDRLNGGYTDNNRKRTEYFNSEISRAERHIRIVFHRFIESNNSRLELSLNGRSLKPIDPLASSHSATQRDPLETLELKRGVVNIRCHTLPHHKKMTKEEWEELAGAEGHLKSQGLYVYREDRLIISGDWLGLARQTELTKLCRIAVDIPNSMDTDWKIDVKKASAQIPPIVRERLKKIIERFVGTSKRTYRSRGHKLVDKYRFPIWNRVQKDGQITFRPNFDHPLFKSYSDQLSPELREGFERCLRLVGSGLPIDTLHAELVGNLEEIAADDVSDDDLKEMVYALADRLMESGIGSSELSNILQANPFLNTYWKKVSVTLENYLKKEIE